ncbi:citrate:proton symporter [uncultured Croceicoccus sp.]|uniref:CitMHS family transporter n=1 Tax=uncultured Croceicoccus sp. TaxID=1295329 RepID=UPI002637D206|nr:citrate:proton symporter [uncultured Croceicoccus sp.]
MLAIGGLLTILLVLAAILSRRMSAFVALSVIPILSALLIGQGGQLGTMIMAGFATVAPTAAMFLFAILFFSIMADAGLFRPVIAGVLRFAGDSPPRIAVGTAVLASIVHLDGSGASTFLITIPAMLPIYDRIGMDRRVLACVTAMAAGVGNMLPWGGPTLRAAASLQVNVVTLFQPVLPIYAVGLFCVLSFSWWLGARQTDHLSADAAMDGSMVFDGAASAGAGPIVLGWRYWINLATVGAAIGVMLAGLLSPAVAFFVALSVAMIVNTPGLAAQRETFERHAPSAIVMVAVLLAAGCFTGILRESEMLDALAGTAAGALSHEAASALPVLIGALGVPLSLLFDPDSFYFGILPVLGNVAEAGGVPAVTVARGAILGQMTTGFAISPLTPATFLLVGLAKIDFAEHQRFTFPFLLAIGLVMTAAGTVMGVLTT